MKHLLLCITISITLLSPVFAENNSELIIKIPDTFYQHPTRLNHPRVDHWHNRGKVAEKAALATLESQQIKVSNCRSESSGKALIVIIPNMFYNVQNATFHSDIKAKVYGPTTVTGYLSKPILTLKGQGQLRGWLSQNSEEFTYQSYRLAIEDIYQQLQKNDDFLAAMSKSAPQNFSGLCEQIDKWSMQELNQ